MPTQSIPITNLAQYGYVPDAAPSTLPPNAFSYSRNWRFNQAGFAEVTRGYSDAYGLEDVNLGSSTTVASFLFTWTLADEPAIIYYDRVNREMRLARIINNVFTEDTLSTAQHQAALEYDWQATELFGIPILNNGTEAPWVFTSTTEGDVTTHSLARLTNFPAGNQARCEFITSYQGFLIACGYQNPDGSAGNTGGSRVLAISDIVEEVGTLPEWDFDNDDSFAQTFDLSLLTDGDIVSAFESNGVLYVNTTTNVISLTYQGDGFFDATVLPFPNGVLTKRSTTNVPNGQFNIGNQRMYIHDGSTAVPIGEGKFVETWFGTVDNGRLDEVQAIYDPRSTSVWIKTPIGSNEQEIWIYNLENDTISVLDDHNEVEYMFFSAEGIPSTAVSWDNLGMDLTWDELDFSSWNDFVIGGSTLRNRLMSVGGRKVFVHDQGQDFNGRAVSAVLRREDLPLSQNTYSSSQISRMILWIGTSSPNTTLSVRVGGSNAINSPTTWTASRTLQVDDSEKIDFRKTVKWGAVEFVSQTTGHRLSGYELEISPQGRR